MVTTQGAKERIMHPFVTE